MRSAYIYESNQKAKFQIQFTIMPFGARASKVLPPPPPPFQIYTKHVNSHARFRLINLTLNIHWFMHCTHTHTQMTARAQVRRTPGYWNKRIRWCSLGGGANATKHSRCAIFTLIWINDILKHAYRLSSVFASYATHLQFVHCTKHWYKCFKKEQYENLKSIRYNMTRFILCIQFIFITYMILL